MNEVEELERIKVTQLFELFIKSIDKRPWFYFYFINYLIIKDYTKKLIYSELLDLCRICLNNTVI